MNERADRMKEKPLDQGQQFIALFMLLMLLALHFLVQVRGKFINLFSFGKNHTQGLIIIQLCF
jgi:hypothetical protein